MFDFFTLLVVILLIMEAVGGVLLVGWWLQRQGSHVLGWWALAHGLGVLLLWFGWYAWGGQLQRMRYAEVGLIAILLLAVVPAFGYMMLRMVKAETSLVRPSQHRTLFHYAASADPAQSDRLAHDLLVALADPQKQLSLHYQPIFDTHTRRVTGFEALVRWQHPTRGAIPPDQFIPLAEANGTISALGRWVLESACITAARWPESWLVSVNLSPLQLQQHRLIRDVRDTLRYSGLPAERLQLEITEGVMVDTANEILNRLKALREMGLRIAIDDFGTGYSSLQYLERLPADTIKIDRTFVNAIESDQAARSIAGAVVRLCHELGHEVVAEGVETEGQLAILAELGCQRTQGWLLGKAIPASAVLPTYGEQAGGTRGEPQANESRGSSLLQVEAGGLHLTEAEGELARG